MFYRFARDTPFPRGVFAGKPLTSGSENVSPFSGATYLGLRGPEKGATGCSCEEVDRPRGEASLFGAATFEDADMRRICSSSWATLFVEFDLKTVEAEMR